MDDEGTKLALDLPPLDQWIEQCCVRGSGRITTAELYASWKAWTEKHKIYTGSMGSFSHSLHKKKGWQKMRSLDQKKQGFAGWGLR